MSAVSNIPENILSNTKESNADAALRHLLKAKENAIHVEHVEQHSNGTQDKITIGVKKKEVPWLLHDTPIENQRPIRVVVIGAGYSGIYLGIRIPEKIRNCELVIYEKNAGIGGTWYENRYLGAACDIPSHSYQFSFNPKPDWSSMYAPSKEIREYIESTAKKYGADRFIKLSHEVTECRWNQDEGKWYLKIRAPDGAIFDDKCDVLISARGLLNTKQWPNVEGLRSFKGEIMHSAEWNEEYDFRGKRIGLIGSGSSAIQILPKLQQMSGTHITCFMRSRTWISPPFGSRAAEEMGLNTNNTLTFTPQQIEEFKTNPKAWFHFRLKVEADSNNIHAITLKGTEMQRAAQEAFDGIMTERLKRKPEYYEWLKPSFAPGCRRLTPGPGFLEALVEENVVFERGGIEKVVGEGLVVAGEEGVRELDCLVCATGFYASAAPRCEVVGMGGRSMREHWHTRATTYLSLATDSFPNHFLMLGPNGAIGEGSLTMMIESTGDYILKAIRKFQRENIKFMVPSPRAVRDFTRYCDAYFKGTVYQDDCKSWYRKDGQGVPGEHVTGLWPGSTLHCIEALRSPRWEDWEYEYLGEENGAEGNVLSWLGNGWGMQQLREGRTDEELAWYLLPEFQERDLGVPVLPKPEENGHFRVRPWCY